MPGRRVEAKDRNAKANNMYNSRLHEFSSSLQVSTSTTGPALQKMKRATIEQTPATPNDVV
jgi:hypothetical protein